MSRTGEMFNRIAGSYDFLNHFFSLGLDRRWRKRLVDELVKEHPRHILDVATGTGDLAIAACRANPLKITGVDVAEDMLAIGRKKVAERGLGHLVELLPGSSENLPFGDGSFDAAMVSFGVRNFDDLQRGLREMRRVLREGGSIHILEFAVPAGFPLRQLYLVYFKHLMPLLGRWISGDRSAYAYLPESVMKFPIGADFTRIMAEAGFHDNSFRRLSCGIVMLYRGVK